MPKSWTDGAPAPVALQDHAHLRDPLTYKIKKWFLGADGCALGLVRSLDAEGLNLSIEESIVR